MNPPIRFKRNNALGRPRNDVLDLYNSCVKPDGKRAESVICQLAAMGYHESHPEPEHWVLSRASVKVHIYSEQELSAFAIHVGAMAASPCVTQRPMEDIS
ncbi:hypothetical protein RE428_32500 [Marinobacter nanhaiticus D15-8W]|uniref:Uncharacterized protein n=1 Tax=Marinobacter nanhaiticus D15-8W TaxID=626887 RepID=N6W1P3_9GAMM|nr:hypothetical protein [Marinobacter nanhaiticus]ENO16445.1 hypothetical protein J057_02005 [Marinobacter nanhaiticus D15-8W]BES72232.1 hypothetical protein RE428_32500 [Marinobacter nanhaiticus D15-8W]